MGYDTVLIESLGKEFKKDLVHGMLSSEIGPLDKKGPGFLPVEMAYVNLFMCPATISLNGTLRIHKPNSASIRKICSGQIHSTYSDLTYLDTSLLFMDTTLNTTRCIKWTDIINNFLLLIYLKILDFFFNGNF